MPEEEDELEGVLGLSEDGDYTKPKPSTEDDVPPVEDKKEEPPKEDPTPVEDKAEEQKPEEPVKEEEEEPAKTKSKNGQIKEIIRLRNKLRKDEVSGPSSGAPTPTPPAPEQPTPGATPPGIPVRVSDDRQSVYLPEDELNAAIERRAREIIADSQQVTPAQRLQAEDNQMEYDFVASDPVARSPILQQYKQADEYLGLKLKELMNSGYVPQSVGDMVHTFEAVGIKEEFDRFFPELGPMLNDIVGAAATMQPAWKRSVLDRMAMSAVPPLDPNPTPEVTKEDVPPLEDVSSTPRSMARRGGNRTKSMDGPEKEFSELEKEFMDNPVGMSVERYNRYLQLGKTLEKEALY